VLHNRTNWPSHRNEGPPTRFADSAAIPKGTMWPLPSRPARSPYGMSALSRSRILFGVYTVLLLWRSGDM